MTKKALLIGILYTNTPSCALRGCINDIIGVKSVLIEQYGYAEKDIIMLRDDVVGGPANFLYPSGQNIWLHLAALVRASQQPGCEEIFVYYSGHGSTMPDPAITNAIDSVIVPADFATSGVIPDYSILSLLKNCSARAITCWDSCNSGSVCDLPYQFTFDAIKKTTTANVAYTPYNHNIGNKQIVSISGCKDSQSSEDIYDTTDQRFEGAFTDAFLKALAKNKYDGSLYKIYCDTCTILGAIEHYTQIPVFSASTNSHDIINLVSTSSAIAAAAAAQTAALIANHKPLIKPNASLPVRVNMLMSNRMQQIKKKTIVSPRSSLSAAAGAAPVPLTKPPRQRFLMLPPAPPAVKTSSAAAAAAQKKRINKNLFAFSIRPRTKNMKFVAPASASAPASLYRGRARAIASPSWMNVMRASSAQDIARVESSATHAVAKRQRQQSSQKPNISMLILSNGI